MEDKGTTLTPIFQFAKNNGLDEEEFFDFVKSKTGADITPEHSETQGFLEKMFDEYADKKFKERPKRDIFKDEKYKEYLEDEEESNPQAEVRYKTPEDLMIPTMSDEDLSNSIDGIERGQSDLTDAEKPIALGWIKDEMKKRKSAIDTNDNGKIEKDEMADFQKSLDDYASKNKKGRDDIPVTTRR